MKICPKCGRQNADEKYCCHCGAKLPALSVTPGTCPNCGFAQNASGSVYCSRCGKKLDGTDRKNPKRLVLAAGAIVAIAAVIVLLFGIYSWQKMVPAESGSSAQDNSQLPASEQWILETDNPVDAETVVLETAASEEVVNAVVEEKRPIAVDGGNKHSVILYNDGTVVTIGDDTYAQRSTSGWRDIIQISTFANHTLGLRSDGTVLAAGDNGSGQCDVSGWSDIVSVAAGSQHSVGVRSDGTVVAAGANGSGQCDVESWTNVKVVAASNTSTFALTNDGKVLVCGSFYNRNMNNWSDIVAISVSTNHVVGIHSNGTVSAVGADDCGQLDNLEKWTDTQQIAVGYGFTAGLRATGKVWVHGCDEHNEHAAMQWTDIVAIGTGTEHILGIKSDGTLVAKGTNDDGQCDVYSLNQQLSGT